PVAGAFPFVVLTRWTYVTVENTPLPLFDAARSNSQGMASASGASACATRAPTTALPSTVEVQLGPCPWVPTWVPVPSNSLASGAFSTQPYVVAPPSAPL